MSKNRLLIQYSIISSIIIVIALISYSLIFNSKTRDYLIKTRIEKFQDIVSIYMEEYPSIHRILISDAPGIQADEKGIKILSKVMVKAGASYIRLWNGKNELLWCDSTPAIKKNPPCNSKGYSEALKGIASYSIEMTDRSSNINSAGGEILRIFIPLAELKKVIGILEINLRTSQIELSNNRFLRVFRIITLSMASFLFISLFFVFSMANRVQGITLKRLEQTQDVTIFALAYQAELRDNETGKHLDRTASYVRILAEELRNDDKYKNYLTASYVSDLVKSAPLHDIGKVGIPDSILRKPSSLTPEEFEVIKNHCKYGVEVLEKASSRLTIQSFLNIAIQLVGSHHEKWDGSGYPKGLSKNSIPVSGRIMALADVYDALRSKRIYKAPIPHDSCVEIISNESGKHFDPVVVKAFLLHEEEFLRISENMKD